jgi:hypothetical protein
VWPVSVGGRFKIRRPTNAAARPVSVRGRAWCSAQPESVTLSISASFLELKILLTQTSPATTPAGHPERIAYTIKIFTKKERENNNNFL